MVIISQCHIQAFDDSDWSTWFSSYSEYMMQMASLAADEKIPVCLRFGSIFGAMSCY